MNWYCNHTAEFGDSSYSHPSLASRHSSEPGTSPRVIRSPERTDSTSEPRVRGRLDEPMEVPFCPSVARVRVFFPLEDPPLALLRENLTALVPVSDRATEQVTCHLHDVLSAKWETRESPSKSTHFRGCAGARARPRRLEVGQLSPARVTAGAARKRIQSTARVGIERVLPGR